MAGSYPNSEYIIVTTPQLVDQLEYFVEQLHLQGVILTPLISPDSTLVVMALFLPLNSLRFHRQLHLNVNECDEIKKDIDEVEKNPTSAEKIYLINKMLETTKFGPNAEMVGLSKLIAKGVIKDAFPLHDGTAELNEDVMFLNDRQLLSAHWSHARKFYLPQPLELIEKYFGPQVAFYYAWLEFFNKMLFIAAVVGIIFFILGIIDYYSIDHAIGDEVCKSNKKMCPMCTNEKYCHFSTLSSYCTYSKWNKFFDSNFTILFSVFMMFWAKLFIIFWKRQESHLKLLWNVEMENMDVDLRTEFREKEKRRRISKYTGEEEPYVIFYEKIFRMTVTLMSCFLMMLIVVFALFGVIYVKMLISSSLSNSRFSFFRNRSTIFSMIIGSTLQVVFIKVFQRFYQPIVTFLTNFENPRTATEYDHSIMYKTFVLAFLNNFAPLFYIAYFKGRFFDNPSKLQETSAFSRHVCFMNCSVSLSIQILFLVSFKKVLGNIITFLTPKVKRIIHLEHAEVVPQWQIEFELAPVGKYHINTEMSEMVILFGFVTFFTGIFTLTPAIALISNLIEIRTDAYKLTNVMRRIVPKKVSGIDSWNGIIDAMFYISTITNAFLLGVTSNLVPRLLYRWKNPDGSLQGYINETLVAFKTEDYDLYQKLSERPKICYFEGHRNPFNHPKKYQLVGDYWLDLSLRLLLVFLFEHIILLLTGLLTVFITTVPGNVKRLINRKRLMHKEKQMKHLDKKQTGDKFNVYLKEVKNIIRKRSNVPQNDKL